MNKLDGLIKKLICEQRSDGSFGRFHTMDSKLNQKIPTTEAAAWLMYENSMTRDNEICNKTCIYMERLLNNLQQWPDNWEKNIWYKPAVPLFISSKLALFGSDNERYKETCGIWINLLISAFKNGSYSAENLNAQSKISFKTDISGSYIGLHSLNNIALYAFNNTQIPPDIQKAYLKWLYNYDGAIGYTNIQPKDLSDNPRSKRINLLLSRFVGFKDVFYNLHNTAV